MTEFITKASAVRDIPKEVKAPTHVIRGRSKSDARLRMIRVLQEITPGSFVYETRIYRRFSSKRTEREIRDVLIEFLEMGYIHRLGTGRRGDPFKIILSTAWPHNRCPLCNHIEYPTVSKDNQEEIAKCT
jgi:hypothetical protein